MHESWLNELEEILCSEYMDNVIQFLRTRKTKVSIYPSSTDIFKVFNLCSYKDIKVVILGQDPYYNPSVADGIAFSSQIDGYIPPSLENIYKEIDSDLYDNKFNVMRSPNLDFLVKQGVFLYNTALTVEIAMPGSHINVWKKFTEEVLKKLNDNDPTVFMLWGNYAKGYKKYITNDKHLILESGHPSPLSANKGLWFGNKHFSKANEFLKGIYGEKGAIDWRTPPF